MLRGASSRAPRENDITNKSKLRNWGQLDGHDEIDRTEQINIPTITQSLLCTMPMDNIDICLI